jgi:hypothetical protein
MAVTITGGEINYEGAFRSVENLTNSTATTLRSFTLYNPVSTIAGGTASGFGVNRYLLPTTGAVEGQFKTIIMLATGEANVIFTGTATGALVLNEANDQITLRYQNAFWMQIAHSATVATATGTA